MREAWRYPFSDDEMFDRGYQVSLFVGFPRSFAIGYWLDSHQGEATLQLYLGPVSLTIWWARR